MEDLAPPLRLIQTIRYSLESGESVRNGLHDYFQQKPDEFMPEVRIWLSLIEGGCQTSALINQIQSPSRRQVLFILEKGLQGEPILKALAGLDEEIQEISLIEIETFLGQLPFKMLLPLLFFIFPAFLLLLLGPLLTKVTSF